ncbi:MAG: hypothetical protein IKU09_07220 [Firmicutes bacterium]|nr:hypothetical protein [Bacillota bacterium]
MKKLIRILICMLLICTMPLTAYADMRPKPSVHVEFINVPDELFYGSLLSLHDSTGPASAWDGTSPYSHWAYGEDGYETWKKFVEYEDADGFWFLQEWWECSGQNPLSWTYYPPSEFKILLYFPDSDTFCVSPIYERYAFDSYFTADLADWESGEMAVVQSYDYTQELVNLAVRIVLTILLELMIAWFFGLRQKSVLAFLAGVNLVTQIGLNVALNVINYKSGQMAFTAGFIGLELVVLAVEIVLYTTFLHRISGNPDLRAKSAVYAVVANAASFAAGLGLAHLIPGIF